MQPQPKMTTFFVQGWIALDDEEPLFPRTYIQPRKEEYPLKVIAPVPQRAPLSDKPVRINAASYEEAVAHYLRGFEFREYDTDPRLDPRGTTDREMPPVKVIVRVGKTEDKAR
jgi:hypothetical protein